jgi:hypothetical protein
MVIHETLFEIAIYRVDPESWTRSAFERIEERKQTYLEGLIRSGFDIDTWTIEQAERMIRFNERPVDWEYNEVIAWLRLVWDGPGPVIKAYSWQVGHARFDGSIKFRSRYQRGFKPYPFVGGDPVHKVFEDWFHQRQPNREIFEQLRESVTYVVGPKGDFPGRYIDLQSFDTVGPHVNWRAIMNLRS